MTVIIVSGTPGSGKTTYAKKLAKDMKIRYIDVNKVIVNLDLSEGLDKERNTKIIDVKKLCRALTAVIRKEKEVVIDSHLSHYLPNKLVDKCIITKCNLKELKARLEKRGYSKKKVRENLDAEIFDVCRVEAMENGHRVEIIDTSTQKH